MNQTQQETRTDAEVIRQEEQPAQIEPKKEDYLKRIMALPPEDQAFLDGYLFAKLTGMRTA